MALRKPDGRLIALVVAAQVLVTAVILGVLFWTSQRDAAGVAEEQPALDSFFRSPAPQSEPTLRANPGRTGFYDSQAVREVGEVDTRFDSFMVSTAPVMADGIIYLAKGGNNLTAIEIETGRELWQHKIREWQPSVPALAGGTIYFGAEDIVALDARTGAERWHFGENAPGETGFGNAPVVASGSVYVTRKGSLYALDAASGAKHWEYTIDEYVIESTAPAFSGGTLFFGAGIDAGGPGNNALYAIDSVTGREKWRHELAGKISSPPVAVDGVVYATATDINQTGGGDPRYPYQSGITGSVYAIDAVTGAELWRFDTGRMIEQPPAVAGGLVFFGDTQISDFGPDSQGSLYALDARSGMELWKNDAGSAISAPSVAENWLYMAVRVQDPAARDGAAEHITLLALDARTGKENWRYDLPQGYSMPAPVFYQDVMYVAPSGLLAIHQAGASSTASTPAAGA
ncbi:MAG: PQQ-like beta-propeller repeat protein [Actinobacteria bacterium]|nr:PQQ-like beta-propeller repeat protein [Actinomycetota bacterium]